MSILTRNVFVHFANHEANLSSVYSIKIITLSAPCTAIFFLICNLPGSVAMDRPLPQSAFVSCWDYDSLTIKK
eukprot:7915906-Ditylum_brightwellii.AAC.1